MNFLYKGKYFRRFKDVLSILDESTNSVVELCFGDTYLANLCIKNNISWTGYDISPYFVNRAKKQGLNANLQDIFELTNLSFIKSDACIMIGSLYHFESDLSNTLKKMLEISNQLIISEPVKNLTNSNSFMRFFARKFTKSGRGEENFRFNKKSLLNTLEKESEILKFTFEVKKENRDLIILIRK